MSEQIRMQDAQRREVIENHRHTVYLWRRSSLRHRILVDVPRPESRALVLQDDQSIVKRRPFVEIGLIAAKAARGIVHAEFDALTRPAFQSFPSLIAVAHTDPTDVEPA